MKHCVFYRQAKRHNLGIGITVFLKWQKEQWQFLEIRDSIKRVCCALSWPLQKEFQNGVWRIGIVMGRIVLYQITADTSH